MKSQYASSRLGLPGRSGAAQDELIWTVAKLTKRVKAGAFRSNVAVRSINREMPFETELAAEILRQILGTTKLPREASGEVANLAVFLHGWQQDINKNV